MDYQQRADEVVADAKGLAQRPEAWPLLDPSAHGIAREDQERVRQRVHSGIAGARRLACRAAYDQATPVFDALRRSTKPGLLVAGFDYALTAALMPDLMDSDERHTLEFPWVSAVRYVPPLPSWQEAEASASEPGDQGDEVLTGAELYARRLALGLGQKELARALGVAQGTLSRWESGRRSIHPSIVAEVTTALDAMEDRQHDEVASRASQPRDMWTDPATGEALPPMAAVAAARAAAVRRHSQARMPPADVIVDSHEGWRPETIEAWDDNPSPQARRKPASAHHEPTPSTTGRTHGSQG